MGLQAAEWMSLPNFEATALARAPHVECTESAPAAAEARPGVLLLRRWPPAKHAVCTTIHAVEPKQIDSN